MKPVVRYLSGNFLDGSFQSHKLVVLSAVMMRALTLLQLLVGALCGEGLFPV